MNASVDDYSYMFFDSATDPSAHIIIGYTTDTETIATAMRNTCTDATAKARIELKKSTSFLASLFDLTKI